MTNETGGYRPLIRNGDGVVGAYQTSAERVRRSDGGLYFREESEGQPIAEIIEPFLNGEKPMGEMPIDILQTWVDAGWKTPHSSFASVERLSAKMNEEWNEFLEAFDRYASDPRPENHYASVSELGDVLWLLVAGASNSGRSMDASVKERLWEYLRGTHIHRQGELAAPSWREAAAKVAIKYESSTLADTQSFAEAGFVPQFTPTMVISEEDIEAPDLHETVSDLGMCLRMLQAGTAQQRAYGGRYDEHEIYHEMLSTGFDHMGKKSISPLLAEAFFRVVSVAHHGLGVSLAEIVQINIHKVNGRIKAGLVDKNDGARPTSLQ